MATFQRITEQNIQALLPYFAQQPYGTCDNTVGVVYQWRKFYADFSIAEDRLCIRMDFGNGAYGYGIPIGSGSFREAFLRIESDAEQQGTALRYCLVPEAAMPLLAARYGQETLTVRKERDWADYEYDADAFRTYAGKALHTQKNHVNRFVREHPEAHMILVQDASEEAMALQFLDDFSKQHTFEGKWEWEEWLGAKDLLRMRKELGQTAACLVDGDRAIGLSIGEVQGDTLYVHVEKAYYNISGAYPSLAQGFVSLFPEVRTVNREDDSGDEGLRMSKLRYRPRTLVEKYSVTVMNQ